MAERTFVALDLETTGLDSDRDTIIEIGAVRFSGSTILERFATFVDPQRPIPLRIQQITNITDRDVAGAPSLVQIAPELLAFVDANVDAVVAHNAPFDIGFLQRAGIHFHRPALDTHELATILLPGLSSYNLGELCRALGIDLPQAHRALGDAEAAARLFMYMHSRIQTLPRSLLHMIVESGGDAQWPPLLLFQDALTNSSPESDWTSSSTTFVAPSRDGASTQHSTPIQIVADSVVERYFADGGPLAQRIGEGYEARQGQVIMARTVLQALNHGTHHLIEAGTGTGKSIAYLLPSALWSLANGRRVVIATDTLTLQDQLIEQEVPRVISLLSEVYPDLPPLQVALLKGRSHYLCLRRLRTWATGRTLSALELRLLTRVLVWLPYTQHGDLSELASYDPKERALWGHITSDPSICTEERCGAIGVDLASDPLMPGTNGGAQDFYWHARQCAESAHLLIVNHALLMADLQSDGRLLPEYTHLIVDEAHRLEHSATEQFTYRVDSSQIAALLKRLPLPADALALLAPQPEWHRQARRIRSQARRLTPFVQTFIESLLRVVVRQPEVKDQLGQSQRIHMEPLHSQPRWSQVEIEWDTISSSIRQLANTIYVLAQELEVARWWQREPEASILAHLQRSHERLTEMESEIEVLIMGSNGQQRETISWLELDAKADVLTFCIAPVHVGDLLESQLLRPRRTVILTGATLRTDDGFEFIQERLGCWNALPIAIESPFDYRANVLIYLPSDVPMPDRSGYQSAVERAIIEAARAAEGRTLVLFTSHAHLRATADAIRMPLDQAGVSVLEHGFSGRGRLLREFRTGRKSVLLGTGTFWEGIDLPGEILSCLVIVRLPFAVPTDPLVAARSRHYDQPFQEYTIPDAVLRFRQGFGRLIRRADDRGVVVLLDSRIWQKSYGTAFLDALPACTVRHAPLMNLAETVPQWLSNKPWSLPGGYDGRAGLSASDW